MILVAEPVRGLFKSYCDKNSGSTLLVEPLDRPSPAGDTSGAAAPPAGYSPDGPTLPSLSGNSSHQALHGSNHRQNYDNSMNMNYIIDICGWEVDWLSIIEYYIYSSILAPEHL